MSAVTEMVGQTNATDPDTAFANFILSHVRQLPKGLKFSCKNEINQVLFRYMSRKIPKPRIWDISQICIEAALFLCI